MVSGCRHIFTFLMLYYYCMTSTQHNLQSSTGRKRREGENKEAHTIKPSLFSVCGCCETIPLSTSYKTSQGFVHPIYHFYHSKGHCHKSTDLQPSGWSSTHQGRKSRHNIRRRKKCSSIWTAGCAFVSCDLKWSGWHFSVSDSVWATVPKPLSIRARRSWNLWIVMVREQIVGRIHRQTKLSAGSASKAEAKTFSRVSWFLQKKSAYHSITGTNYY